MKTTAVIVAAGSASRMCGIDKIITPLDGVPLLLQTVRAVAACSRIDCILVVTRADLTEKVELLCAGEEKVCGVIVGGATRAESVLRGLLHVQTPLVAIHDGARPLVTVEVIEAAIEAAEICGAAAPAIAVHDTIKVAHNGTVAATPDRSTLFAVQTPQVFALDRIRAALQSAIENGVPLTDDCSAAELADMRVLLTAGDEENLKITTPLDLAIAAAIMERRRALV